MKLNLTLLFATIPLFIFSQKRDTTFSQVGDYEFMEIKEIHKTNIPNDSKFKTDEEEEDYFMRKGYSTFAIEKRRSYRDSIIYFHENEKIKKIRCGRRNYAFNYDEEWKFTYVHFENYKTYKNTYMFWENLSFEIKELNPQMDGKFGDEINFEFSLKNRSSEKQELQLTTSHSFIRLESSQLLFPPNTEKMIRMKIKMTYDEAKKGLIFTNDKNQKFKYPLDVIGFDLDDNDFHSIYFYKNQLPFDVGNREDIIIKLDDGERLLRIYQGDELMWNHPIGRIVNTVNIAYLEGGEYLLEIVDLKNNEKKYCRIKKEGAN